MMKITGSIKTNILVFVFFAVLTVIMTLPTARYMGTRMPSGDSMLNTWVISWDLHKITTGLGGLWDANIFHPNNNTLTYTEHHLGNAIIGLPVWLVTRNPVITYNYIFLMTFILSGFGVYLLARHLSGNTPIISF